MSTGGADGQAPLATATTPAVPAAGAQVLPLAVIDQCVGGRVLVVMKSNKEVEGTLLGLDEFVNLVLEDVVEYESPTNNAVGNVNGNVDGSKVVEVARRTQLLLNGNNIAMLVPGGRQTL